MNEKRSRMAHSIQYRSRISDREWQHNLIWPCGAKRLEDEPEGYVQWHEWAEKKERTHQQQQCPSCNLWHIWERKG